MEIEIEGSEIFLLVSDRGTNDSPTTSLAFANQDDLNAALVNESFGDLDDENIEVFHGVLTSPKYLPESINGCTPYIMVHNNGDISEVGCLNEVIFIKGPPDVNRLVEVIEGFIGTTVFTNNTSPNIIKMDDIQLFFGHKIPLVFHINEDYIDEELIERVLKVSEKMKKIKKDTNKERVNEVNSNT